MKNKKINNFKKIMDANFIFTCAIIISIILMFIGWFNTHRLNNWHGIYSWVIFIFLSLSIILDVLLLGVLGFKIRLKARREKSKESEINVFFLKIFHIVISALVLLINLFWLFLACWYYLEIHMIQAIFMIIISILSIFYICYCFYYYFKIKITKIKMADILENEKNKWGYLRSINFDQENKD